MNLERSKQDVPAEIMDDLMGVVRSSFYPGNDRWFKDQHFIRRNFVTWPAAWLNAKGVTLPAERYKAIVMDVIIGIKQHGQTENVKYWPGYLKHCLQAHFQVHGDEIYQEALAVSRKVEGALLACQRSGMAAPHRPHMIAVLALARQLIRPSRRAPRKADGQLNLL